MGGVEVDSEFRVDGIKSCFAIGEVSNSHLHGANRLGGNSLLEIIVAGRLAGETSATEAKSKEFKEPSEMHIRKSSNLIQSILATKGDESIYILERSLERFSLEMLALLEMVIV